MVARSYRYRLDPEEVAQSTRARSHARNVPMQRAFGVLSVILGSLQIAIYLASHDRDGAFLSLGVLKVLLGSAALVFSSLLSRATYFERREIAFTIDERGIEIAEPRPDRFSWKQLKAVDNDGMYLYLTFYRYGIVPLPLRVVGTDLESLWADFRRKLTGTRYLALGSDTKSRIVNTAAA